MGTNIKSNKNQLNDLTGSEWKFSTKTVISKSYPINLQHKLRSEHGGEKPPKLCEDIIKIFTKKGQIVLDPFMGVGGSLLGASLCGRRSIGIDITPRWIEIYKQVCDLERLEEGITYCGDSYHELDKIDDESVDFILTDVPYWNIDSVEKTRSKKASISKLSNFKCDNEDQSKLEWLNQMKNILEKASKKLKNNQYMAVFIGDIYRGKQYHCLSAELANKLQEIPGMVWKSNIIWFDNSKSLHVFGYPYSYVPSMIHQNILVFKKESK